MGLQSQLSDVSSDSPLLLLVALLARALTYLHSLLLTLLHALGIHANRQRPDPHATALGSALILLCDQLNLNRSCSASLHDDADCVVCLSPMREGDHLRTLPCRHLFHKDCFDGWLHHLNFSCPLCRAPLVSDERVAEDLLTWLPLR